MTSVALSFVLAMLATAALTPLVRKLALALGAVDSPSARRMHAHRVPRLGGIAIVIGFFLPLVVLFALNTGLAKIFFGQPKMVGGLAVGALLVAGLGFSDDVLGVGAKAKLVIQIAAASAAYAGGLRISAVVLPGMGPLDLGLFAYPATVLWIVGIINALNLVDGLDGLAAGVGFFACVTNFVVAYLGQNVLISFMAATLGGAIVGFLFYNFNPAKIFMGDSGSMFLGFILATASLLGAGTQKTPTLLAILVPLIALGLPIIDMLFAIARRFVERRSIFAADRGHIHHRLVDLGLTQRRAVFVLYGLSIAFTLVALAVHFGRSWQVGAALVLLTGLVLGIARFARRISVQIARARGVVLDETTDRIRRALPKLIARMEAPQRGAEDIREMLEAFGKTCGLSSVEFDARESTRLDSFKWEPEPTVDDAAQPSEPKIRQERSETELVNAVFNVLDDRDRVTVLSFTWESDDASLSPRTETLLLLVADGLEGWMRRPAQAREASSKGWLRTVS